MATVVTNDAQPATMRDAFELMDRDDVLTEDVMTQLREAIGDQPITEIGALRVFELVSRLRPNMPSTPNLTAIARTLLKALRDLELIEDATAPAAPSGPMQVEVTLPARPSEMSLRELLAHLIAHPEQFSELWPIIAANPTVAAASAKALNWVVPTADGGIDLEATVIYLTKLSAEFSVPQRMLADGRRPITLQRAFGQQERPLIHRFTFEPVIGPDALGFDWGTLDERLHCALLWAQATKHPLWPTSVDQFQCSTEVFQSPLPDRWHRILDDYRAACADDPGNTISSRYYTDELLQIVHNAQAGGAAPFGRAAGNSAASEERTDDWYQARLKAVGRSSIGRTGGSVRLSRCIIDGNVDVTGGSVILNDVIVLGNVDTIGGSVSGTIYMPFRCRIDVTGGSDRSATYNRSWRKLYELAVQWGIISDEPQSARSVVVGGNVSGIISTGDGSTNGRRW